MDYAAEVHELGYAVLPQMFPAETLDALIAAVDAVSHDSSAVRTRGSSRATYAVRNLLTLVPEARALASNSALSDVVSNVLGAAAFPVRGLLFDKTPDANWRVGWHQDVAIPVLERRDVDGFSGWSTKAGVEHVEAPASVLEKMLAVRVHLDDCGINNAPLQVLAGSHRWGRVDYAAIAAKKLPAETLTVQRGDVILMKPLTFHASQAATEARHRRVIHIEFASGDLPGGLQWAVS